MTSLDKRVVNRAARVPSGLRQWEVTPISSSAVDNPGTICWDGSTMRWWYACHLHWMSNARRNKPLLSHWDIGVHLFSTLPCPDKYAMLTWKPCHLLLWAGRSQVTSLQKTKTKTKKGELGKSGSYTEPRETADSCQGSGQVFSSRLQACVPLQCTLQYSPYFPHKPVQVSFSYSTDNRALIKPLAFPYQPRLAGDMQTGALRHPNSKRHYWIEK